MHALRSLACLSPVFLLALYLQKKIDRSVLTESYTADS